MNAKPKKDEAAQPPVPAPAPPPAPGPISPEEQAEIDDPHIYRRGPPRFLPLLIRKRLRKYQEGVVPVATLDRMYGADAAEGFDPGKAPPEK